MRILKQTGVLRLDRHKIVASYPSFDVFEFFYMPGNEPRADPVKAGCEGSSIAYGVWMRPDKPEFPRDTFEMIVAGTTPEEAAEKAMRLANICETPLS